MSILRLDRTYRNIARFRQVIAVLIRYGLGGLVASSKVDYYYAWVKSFITRRKPPMKVSALDRPTRVRMVLEELGPTFIKLGQMLSNRPDVVPIQYAAEMTKLLDRVKPVETDKIHARIAAELGQQVDVLFESFEENPIGAASIAQVHAARLKSGEDVVVKVVRPGIETVIETDLDILAEIALLLQRHVPEASVMDPVGLVQEFSRALRLELDLSREGRIIERFASNFADDDTVYVPSVHWQFCSRKVLTLERMPGKKLSEVDFDTKSREERDAIAQNGAKAALKQILVHGLFHADPHLGNLFLLDGNRLGLVDYGMVGRLDEDTRDLIADLLFALGQGRPEKVADILLESQGPVGKFNRSAFVRDVMEMCDLYLDIPLKQVVVSSLFTDLIQIMNRHSIRFPRDLMVLSRALITVEGVGRRLDPEFNIIETARPFVADFIKNRIGTKRLAREAGETLGHYLTLIKTLPRDLTSLAKRLKESEVEIGFVHKGLETFSSDLERSLGRLTLGIIMSALIVGSSYLVTADTETHVLSLPLYSFVGFLAAIVVGAILVISLFRSN